MGQYISECAAVGGRLSVEGKEGRLRGKAWWDDEARRERSDGGDWWCGYARGELFYMPVAVGAMHHRQFFAKVEVASLRALTERAKL